MANLVMFDDVTVSLMPAGYSAYAGYANGRYANLTAIRARFPKAHILDIAVTASVDATCLDVETGDATNAQSVAWVKKQHSRGLKLPVVYTSAGNAQALINTLANGGVARDSYLLWTAHYTNHSHICSKSGDKYPNADGTQWTSTAMGRSLDESLVSDAFFSNTNSASGTAYTPVLSLGTSNASVGQAQTLLNKWQPTVKTYAALKVDDDFGPATKTAVVDFQTYAKLSVDGEVGPQTWAALEKSPDTKLELPTGFTYVVTDNQITVSWKAAPGATDYDCQLMSSDEKTQVKRGSVKTTHVIFGNLAPSTTYKFRVVSEAAGKTSSGWSGYASVATKAADTFPAPKSLTVSPWIKRDVSWQAASFNGKAAASYTLQILDVNGKPFAETTVKGLSYTVSVPKGTYEIRVWANGANVAPPHASVKLVTE